MYDARPISTLESTYEYAHFPKSKHILHMPYTVPRTKRGNIENHNTFGIRFNKNNMKDRIQLEFYGVFVHSENINIPIRTTANTAWVEKQEQSAKERLKNIGLPM